MLCPGEPIAPLLNTNPAQTLHHQTSQLATSPAHFPVTVVGGENVAPGYNTVPAQVPRYYLHSKCLCTLSKCLQTAAHENHLLIAQQQQLQQLIDAQTIQVSSSISTVSTISTRYLHYLRCSTESSSRRLRPPATSAVCRLGP